LVTGYIDGIWLSISIWVLQRSRSGHKVISGIFLASSELIRSEARIGGGMGRKPNFYIERIIIGAVPNFVLQCNVHEEARSVAEPS
jgi:hypothetical protein